MDQEKLPERYVGQITQNDYEIIIKHSKNFLQEKGTIKKIEDGVIYVVLNDDSDNVNQLALDNLLRSCKQEDDKAKWREIIVDHFTRLTTKVNLDRSDFDKCRDLIAIRIYPEYEEKTKALMIFKVDFPGTMSTLVLDLPDKYESIDEETIDLWRVPIDSLFYIAQENVNKRDGIEIREAKETETKRVYSFFSPDHSASYIRDIKRNADFAIGEFGAFVAIPTRGSAFVIPIEDKSAIEALDKLRPTIKLFFDEDPGSITADIFWYYNDRFELVEVINDEIVLPHELKTKI
ncbi:hypothetical protein [Pontibacter ruber]|nr:hypothetical protein [Pontibacter ruber]